MVTLTHYLTLSVILFSLSVAGIFLNRKNVIILLMCIEHLAFEHDNGEHEGYRDTYYGQPMNPTPANLPAEQAREDRRTEWT